MKTKQKKVLLAGMLVIVLMGIFPPWTYTFKTQYVNSERPAGYSFIMNPPVPEGKYDSKGIDFTGLTLNPLPVDHRLSVKLDISRLIVQCLIVSALTGVGIMLSSGRGEK